jgi:hypothetical protein
MLTYYCTSRPGLEGCAQEHAPCSDFLLLFFCFSVRVQMAPQLRRLQIDDVLVSASLASPVTAMPVTVKLSRCNYRALGPGVVIIEAKSRK